MSVFTQILTLLVPFLIGLVASKVWAGFEKLPLKLDELPSLVKPPVIAIVAWAVGLLANLLQVQLPADLHAWTPDTVHSLLAAGAAFLIHAIDQRAKAKAAAAAAVVPPGGSVV